MPPSAITDAANEDFPLFLPVSAILTLAEYWAFLVTHSAALISSAASGQ